MTEGEQKAHREGFLLAVRSLFVADNVFRSIERSVNDCGSGEWVRIDQQQWDKLIRQAHKALAHDERKLKDTREQVPERRCGLCTDTKPCNFEACPDETPERSTKQEVNSGSETL